jgi:predicted protein tyrosine phosphatase
LLTALEPALQAGRGHGRWRHADTLVRALPIRGIAGWWSGFPLPVVGGGEGCVGGVRAHAAVMPVTDAVGVGVACSGTGLAVPCFELVPHQREKERVQMTEPKAAPSWEDESRIGNVSNHYQGNYRRVLCVCAGGLLRSPTTAWVLGQEPYNYNTRAAGVVSEYALVKVDTVLLSWCDEIVCMEREHVRPIEEMLKNVLCGKVKKIVVLDIPDQFAYRDPKLVELIKRRYAEETCDQQSRPIMEPRSKRRS